MGLTSLVQSLLDFGDYGYSNESTQELYQTIIQLFRSDPEINPNWSLMFRPYKLSGQFITTSSMLNRQIKLWEIINMYGSIDDLVYIFQRPEFEWNRARVISFTDNISPDHSNQLLTVFKNTGLSISNLDPKLRNIFGFQKPNHWAMEFPTLSEHHLHLPEINEIDTEVKDESVWGRTLSLLVPTINNAEDEDDDKGDETGTVSSNDNEELNGITEPVKSNETHCVGCLEKVDRTQIRFNGPAVCKCQFHLDCALNLAVSFINQVSDPNPLEQKIINCPGCQEEIKPSFLVEFKQTLGTLASILDIVEHLPTNFLIDYKQAIRVLVGLNVSMLNQRIFILIWRAHPKFVACPRVNCQGFALIDPDEEKLTGCLICNGNSRFIGKQRRLEMEKNTSEIKNLLSSTDRIRPCYNCGKLIEKLDGCNSMRCTFCNQSFNWETARNAKTVNPSLTAHF